MKLLHQNHKIALAFIGGVFAAFILDKAWDHLRVKTNTSNYSNYMDITNNPDSLEIIRQEYIKKFVTVLLNRRSDVIKIMNDAGIYVNPNTSDKEISSLFFAGINAKNMKLTNEMGDLMKNYFNGKGN